MIARVCLLVIIEVLIVHLLSFDQSLQQPLLDSIGFIKLLVPRMSDSTEESPVDYQPPNKRIKRSDHTRGWIEYGDNTHMCGGSTEPSHLSSEELPRVEPEASTSNVSTSADDIIDLSIQKEKHFDGSTEPSHLSSEELPRVEPEASTSNVSTSASDTIDLRSIQKEKYFTGAVTTCIPSKYMKSQSFTSLLQKVRSKIDQSKSHDDILITPILIKGPKGAGKTMCLLTLLCILYSQDTVVVFASSKSFRQQEKSKLYLKMVATQYDIDVSTQHNLPFADCLLPFFDLARQKKKQVLLLLDFDNFQDIEQINKMAEIVKAGAVQGGIVIVLAVSSGGGCNALQLDVKSFLSLDQICERVMFLPFTDVEVQRFIRLHSIQLSETALKPITGNNPYLLSLAVTCNNERDLQMAVAKNVKAFAKQNLQIHNQLPEAFLLSLEPSEKYFWMAFNNYPIKDPGEIREFDNSWVGEHGVCYTEQDGEDIVIKINFPTLPAYLKADIQKLVQTNKVNISKYPQVKGFILEEVFFNYVTTHSKLVVVNDKHGFTFNVACVLPFNNEVGMKANVLYRSRMYHPAIDAVGIFQQDDGFLLVFIQISKSLYKEHRSKILHVMADRYKCRGYGELTANHKSIHAFYKSKAEELTSVTGVCYIYLSTETISNSGDDELRRDAAKYHIQYAVLEGHTDLCKQFNIQIQP